MTKHLFIFAATFIVGALIALAARTASHDPHQPAVETPLAAEPKTQNAKPKTQNPPSVAVNTVCAICGMKVDPKLPTLEYQGKQIAFGCRMCPPKFKANPDKYGPYYLRNEVMPK